MSHKRKGHCKKYDREIGQKPAPERPSLFSWRTNLIVVSIAIAWIRTVQTKTKEPSASETKLRFEESVPSFGYQKGDPDDNLLSGSGCREVFTYYFCGLLGEIMSSSEISPKETDLAGYIALE